MIVEMFVSRDAIGQIDLAGETTVRQDLHCPVYRGVADARVLFANGPIDILDASMALVIQKSIEDELTMRCEFEFALLQILHEDLHLRGENLHGAGCVGSNFTTSL